LDDSFFRFRSGFEVRYTHFCILLSCKRSVSGKICPDAKDSMLQIGESQAAGPKKVFALRSFAQSVIQLTAHAVVVDAVAVHS